MAIEILHLSSVVKSALVDRDGDRLGRVEDLIVRVGDSPHPPLSGVVVRIGRRAMFVPIHRIADIRPRDLDQLALILEKMRSGQSVPLVLLRYRDSVASRIDINLTLP